MPCPMPATNKAGEFHHREDSRCLSLHTCSSALPFHPLEPSVGTNTSGKTALSFQPTWISCLRRMMSLLSYCIYQAAVSYVEIGDTAQRGKSIRRSGRGGGYAPESLLLAHTEQQVFPRNLSHLLGLVHNINRE